MHKNKHAFTSSVVIGERFKWKVEKQNKWASGDQGHYSDISPRVLGHIKVINQDHYTLRYYLRYSDIAESKILVGQMLSLACIFICTFIAVK